MKESKQSRVRLPKVDFIKLIELAKIADLEPRELLSFVVSKNKVNGFVLPDRPNLELKEFPSNEKSPAGPRNITMYAATSALSSLSANPKSDPVLFAYERLENPFQYASDVANAAVKGKSLPQLSDLELSRNFALELLEDVNASLKEPNGWLEGKDRRTAEIFLVAFEVLLKNNPELKRQLKRNCKKAPINIDRLSTLIYEYGRDHARNYNFVEADMQPEGIAKRMRMIIKPEYELKPPTSTLQKSRKVQK